ncbi:hypothetical protein CCP3SC1_30073 [Gammaproteobacteria bacterium]
MSRSWFNIVCGGRYGLLNYSMAMDCEFRREILVEQSYYLRSLGQRKALPNFCTGRILEAAVIRLSSGPWICSPPMLLLSSLSLDLRKKHTLNT